MPAERLRDLQAWLQDAILDRAGEAEAEVEVEARVAASARLPAAQRLAIYQRGYLARLLDCLRAHFPVARHLLGAGLFDEFAKDYLRARPSRSYTLEVLGAGFADHLAATRPDVAAGQREPWIDLLLDVIRFERAFTEAHAAPGAESIEPPPAPDGPDRAGVTVSTVECLRLVRACFPVHTLAVAVRAGQNPPMPAPAEVWLALARKNFVVTVTELDEPRFRLLAALRDGMPLGRAAAGAGLGSQEEADACLRSWLSDRLIVAINERMPHR